MSCDRVSLSTDRRTCRRTNGQQNAAFLQMALSRFAGGSLLYLIVGLTPIWVVTNWVFRAAHACFSLRAHWRRGYRDWKIESISVSVCASFLAYWAFSFISPAWPRTSARIFARWSFFGLLWLTTTTTSLWTLIVRYFLSFPVNSVRESKFFSYRGVCF